MVSNRKYAHLSLEANDEVSQRLARASMSSRSAYYTSGSRLVDELLRRVIVNGRRG